MTYGQTDMICRQTTRKTDQLQGLTVWRMRGRAWCAAWLQGCAAIFGSEAENNNITNDTSIQTIQNTLAVSYFTNGHLWMQSGLLLSLMNFVQEAGAIIFIQHTSNTRGIRWGLYRQEPQKTIEDKRFKEEMSNRIMTVGEKAKCVVQNSCI